MPPTREEQPIMHAGDLYREDVFTDRRVGNIRQLTPVRLDGSTDPDRELVFVGQASLYTPAGAIPLEFELEAKTLKEALADYPIAARKAVDKTMEQLKELRREAASSIVVPEGGQGFGPGGRGGPGGGKIQMP